MEWLKRTVYEVYKGETVPTALYSTHMHCVYPGTTPKSRNGVRLSVQGLALDALNHQQQSGSEITTTTAIELILQGAIDRHQTQTWSYDQLFSRHSPEIHCRTSSICVSSHAG